MAKKKKVSKPAKKAKGNNPNLVKDGEATQWQPGQSGNPLGKPIQKSNAVYWENKYAGFTKAEIKKELKSLTITGVQIAALKHWLEMMKDPSDGHMAWPRYKELCERDAPKDSTPLQDINITIIREE